MFGRRSTASKIDAVDAAYDQAEANAREFGKTVADQIAKRYRAGTIDAAGVDELVEIALSQTADKAAGVPNAMLRQILTTLHRTIRADLAAAGITIPELPA